MLLQPQPTSPFPSPSSSFVPPPAQEAHEFANKTTARMAAAKQPRSDSHSRRNSREDTHDSPQPQPQPLPPPTPTLKRFSADSSHSLASSRPAPASPALSRHSSLLHTGSKKRLSTLSIVSTSTPPPALTPRSVPIKIRDFAYSFDDDRHHGKWPYSNRDSLQGDDDSSSEGYFEPGYGERDGSEDEEEEDDEDEQPFVPGIYRAMYAFVPEGTAEMALAEDQHVRVLGRGGGVGWVVVLKTDGNEPEQALVPEGYLALVRADTELDDDDEDESVSATEAPQTPRALS